MKRLPPSPVPPISDTTIARLERNVFAALDARGPEVVAPAHPIRRRVVALSMAGAVAAMTVLGVRELRRGDGTAPAQIATAPAQITTATSGSRMAIPGASLEIAPESAVSFGAGKDGATVVVLDRGAVTCEVAPRTARAPFVVEAGATRVTVIGTRFTVRRLGAHATVSVEHGLVEVADTNMTELVHAGETFRPGEPVSREPLASEVPAAPVVAAPVVPVAVATPVHRAHERRVALASPVIAAPQAARAPVEAAPAEAPAAPAEAPAPAAPAHENVNRGSVQVLFELAAQLEVRDPPTALGIYGQIAAGDDAWAASALFASARLEAERSRAPSARALAEAYLQRFPRGPNADDARALLAAAR
ncbi:MAG TPA: FecR domain-containing protein [Polyangia bacterium]|nr:FecR domain-containing protein [Polyangia bacterium]